MSLFELLLPMESLAFSPTAPAFVSNCILDPVGNTFKVAEEGSIGVPGLQLAIRLGSSCQVMDVGVLQKKYVGHNSALDDPDGHRVQKVPLN